MCTGTIAVYLVMAMSNQSQPHMETTSSRSEGGQSPSTGNGNPAPATGHGARLVGDSGSESGPSHSMSSPDCRGKSGDHRHYLPVGHGARLGASVRPRRDLSASSPDRRGRSGYERQRHGNHDRKGDRQRALPVATGFLCLGTGPGVPSQMIGLRDLLLGTPN